MPFNILKKIVTRMKLSFDLIHIHLKASLSDKSVFMDIERKHPFENLEKNLKLLWKVDIFPFSLKIPLYFLLR